MTPTTPRRLPRSLLDALGALTEHEYLVAGQSNNLAEGVCAYLTLNRLRDRALVVITYHGGTGKRIARITDEGREVWRSGPGVGQWPRPLTERQREALGALHKSGPWNPDRPAWTRGTPSATRKTLDALVRKGWARVAENGDYIPITEHREEG